MNPFQPFLVVYMCLPDVSMTPAAVELASSWTNLFTPSYLDPTWDLTLLSFAIPSNARELRRCLQSEKVCRKEHQGAALPLLVNQSNKPS